MMRSILVATALISTGVSAHDCNIDFDGHIKLHNNEMTVELQDHRMMTTDGQQVWLEGETLQLDAKQLELVQQYHSGVMKVAPQAAEIALDAVSLAGEGVGLAFSKLLGEDDDVVKELNSEFDSLRHSLNEHFYAADGSVRFDSQDFQNGHFAGGEFEQRFEKKIEDLVERSMGSLMVAVGKQMLFGDGDDSFEQRMEEFGETVEHEMEFRGEKIEFKAEQLCFSLTHIDDIETRISQSIPELAELDVIDTSHHHDRM